MSRKLRFFVAGVPYHVIHRGNNKMPVFLNDGDRYLFLDILKDAKEKYFCKIHSYCLMNNHIHLLIVPSNSPEDLSNFVRNCAGRYTIYFNKIHGRTGTLWEGRFKAAMINSERYFISCLHYIESNPVRAKLVISAANYPWSSYKVRALGANSFIGVDPWYESLHEDPFKRQELYRKLFEMDKGADFDLIRVKTSKNKDLDDQK